MKNPISTYIQRKKERKKTRLITKIINALLFDNYDVISSINMEDYVADTAFNSNFVLMDSLYKCGLKDEYKDISSLYYHLKTNNYRHPLKEMLKGKSIAVVGNGPQQMGKHTGAEINSHDIVVRFNAWQHLSEEFRGDYGAKTTICITPCVFWGFNDIDRWKMVSKHIESGLKETPILIIHDLFYHIDRSFLNKDLLAILVERFKNNKQSIFSYDLLCDSLFQPSLGIKRPTLGFCFISYLYESGLLNNADIYGFTFLNRKLSEEKLEFYDDTKNLAHSANAHCLDIESEIILQMLEKAAL